MSLDPIREVAVRAARAAGAVQREHCETRLEVDAAPGHDLKLAVDRLCEEAVVETIRAAFPDHAILAEEGGARPGTGDCTWIIDPLDGTVNYFHGIPYFATCVACYRKTPGSKGTPGENRVFPREADSLGEPLVGVVYVPPVDELYLGVAGEGATRNGEPVTVSDAAALREVMIATGFGSTDENIRHMQGIGRALVSEVRKIRCLGAAAFDMANVAAGRLTAYYERGIRSWDFAAPNVVLREAGATVEAVEYAPDTWEVLAAAPGVAEALAAVVARSGTPRPTG
jgi:fructose-1,6-bisphosphatase/inositol monophosphatase family enzyme